MSALHDIGILLSVRFKAIRFSFFTAANAVIVFIGDLMQPIGSVVALLCIVTPILVLALGAFLLRMVARQRPIDYESPTTGIAWTSDATIFLAVGFPLLFATFVWQEATRTDEANARTADIGAFATMFPGLARAQASIGIIEKRLVQVDEKLTVIQSDVREARQELGTLKKETSVDPRKELSNMGVGWTEQEFIDAIMRADLRALELFLDGGMSPLLNHNGASAALFGLQPDGPDPRPVLQLLISKGFDVNARLVDAYIMRSHGDTVPPFFDTPDTPKGYSAWQRKFVGPALLWVVILASYRGPSDHDLAVIEFLLDHGADRRATDSFMAAYQPIWGDTGAWQQVAAVLNEHK